MDQGASQTVHRGLRVVLANGNQVAILLLHLDAARQSSIQFAFWALDGNYIALNIDGHALG
jgi:hypothetical protein